MGMAEVAYRWVLLRLANKYRFKVIKAITDFWFPVHWRFRDTVLVLKILGRLSPVHFYYRQFPLRDRHRYYEWALLDTHDALTTVYKHHRTVRQIREFLQKIGAKDVKIHLGGNGVEAFCTK